jgi:hypothetical protein
VILLVTMSDPTESPTTPADPTLADLALEVRSTNAELHHVPLALQRVPEAVR